MAESKNDKVLLEAVELARAAAVAVAEPDTVGEHIGMAQDAERLATHFFVCTAAGYPGWAWAVSAGSRRQDSHAAPAGPVTSRPMRL